MAYNKMTSSREIERGINNWSERYGNNKSLAIGEILDSIKEGYCDNDTIVESEARNLCRQMTRVLFEQDISGCKPAIQKNYLANDGSSKTQSFNSMLDLMIEGYDTIERRNSMKVNLKSLDKKFHIQKMFNEHKAFNSELYAKTAIDKLSNTIYETYKDKMPIERLMTICMESSKLIFEAKPGVISNESVLKNITDFFIIKTDINVEEIGEALNDLKLYENSDIKAIQESLSSLNEALLLNESDDLSVDSKEFKQMVRRNSFKIRKVFDDIIKQVKTGSQNKSINVHNQHRKFSDSILKSLYGTPTETILTGAPDLLGLIRKVLLYGSAASVTPVLVIPAIIIDILIQNNVDTREIPSVIKMLEMEKTVVQDSLNDKNTNPENIEGLKSHMKELDNQIEKLNDYMRMHELKINIHEDYHNENYNYNIGIIQAISEVMTNTDIVLTEGAIKNTMRKAKEKLKKAMETIEAKDKMASRTLDDAVDKFTDKFEKSVTLDNREKVIKGSVLPDASKVIKLGVASAAAWSIAPAVAVVGALGSWAISKNVRARERQLVLDEIEIELKIVERKIQQADMNNDIEAVEQLMKLEGTLKREQQRIKYRQKAYR